MNLNLSGSVNVFRLLLKPSLCLPHYTCSTFEDLPTSDLVGGRIRIPIPESRQKRNPDGSAQTSQIIKAVVLDKDNCFAAPHKNEIYPAYQSKFEKLREAYPNGRLLIVSNTAGTLFDSDGSQARLLEKNTLVSVLKHSTKKPGCHAEVLEYFRKTPGLEDITSPSDIAVVGDRLFTDIMLANMMGAHGIWIKDGVSESKSVFSKLEIWLQAFLCKRQIPPPDPKSEFE